MKNPLQQYKDDNKMTFPQLKKILGLGMVTTQRLVNETPESLKKKKLETFFIIEKTTGVDMISYIKNNN